MLFLKNIWAYRLQFKKISLTEQSFLKVKATGIEISSNTLRYFFFFTDYHKRHKCLTAVCYTSKAEHCFLAGSSHTFIQLSHLPWTFANLFLRCIFPAFRSAHRFSKAKEERSSLSTLCITAFEIRHEHKWGCKELYGKLLPN